MKIIALALNENTRSLENNTYINTESKIHKDWVLMLLDSAMVIAKSPKGGIYMIPTNAISHMLMDPDECPACYSAAEPHPEKDNFGNVPGDSGYRGPATPPAKPTRKKRQPKKPQPPSGTGNQLATGTVIA